ncbi:MAG: TonB-dependent receptor [Caulobacteraceae bacterium]
MTRRFGLFASCGAAAVLAWAGVAAAQTTKSNQGQGATQPGNAGVQTPGAEQAAKRAEEMQQNTQAASATTVGELVVTATSRATALQHLPVAVSVYTDERRNLVGIETESDIVNFTPSMSLNGEFLSIRGVGRYTDELGTDPGVAVFVDGIYTPSPDYLNQPDFFTDRIEVLRGPQGTLGGQNDIGGSVNVVEKRPTVDFHTEERAGLDTNEYYLEGSVSGPITSNLDFRLADVYADYPSQNQFVKNLDNPTSPGTGWSNLFEAQLEWKPTSRFDAWLKVQNFASDNAATYGVNPDEYPPFPANTPFGIANCPTVNGADYLCLAPAPADLLSPTSNPEIKNPWVVDNNVVGFVKEKGDWTFTTHLTYDFPGITLEYIGGYSQYNYLYRSDLDGTPSAVNPGLPSGFLSQVNTGFQNEQWYQNELQLKSTGNTKLQWIAGVFQYHNWYYAPYYDEEPNNPTLATPTGGPPVPNRSYYGQVATLTDEAEAVYGDVSYQLTDTLKLTGGLRYNWDRKVGTVDYHELFDTAGVFFDAALPASYVTDVDEGSTISSSDWTGKIGADWQPDPSTLVYANITKGYKSGGMGLLDISPVPTVGPETLYDFEGGIKKSVGGKLLVDADAYYYDYHNLQQFLSVENSLGLISSELISAQKARTYGFELESVWSPNPDFSLTFNYSYLNARFTKFSLPGGIIDVSQLAPGCVGTGVAGPPGTPGQCVSVSYANLNGNTIPQSPENKFTINPVYTFHFPVGNVTISATYAWIAKQYYAVFNNSNYLSPSYYDLDLRLLYQPPKGHYTIILYARNVTNQRQIVNYTTGSWEYGPANLVTPPAAFPSSGQVTYYVNEPRVIGAEIQVRF